MIIRYQPGRHHGNADGLSRIPDVVRSRTDYIPKIELDQLPYKGCKYCTRAHRDWARVLQDVDVAVPLTRKGKAPNKPVEEPATALVELFTETVEIVQEQNY